MEKIEQRIPVKDLYMGVVGLSPRVAQPHRTTPTKTKNAAMAKDTQGQLYHRQEDTNDRDQTGSNYTLQQACDFVQNRQSQRNSQEFSTATALTQLQLEQLLAANTQGVSHNNNIMGSSGTSASSVLGSAAHMNVRHQGLIDGGYGITAPQRQLLSALLSEGLLSSAGTRAPLSIQASLEALQRSQSATDRSQALATINRALQDQLIMGELLRSSGAQQDSSHAATSHLLETLQGRSFQGFESQTSRSQLSFSRPQQQPVAPSSCEAGTPTPRSGDTHPSRKETIVGTDSSPTSGIFSSASVNKKQIVEASGDKRKIKEEEGDNRKVKEEGDKRKVKEEGDKRKIKEEEGDKRKIKEEEGDKRKIKEEEGDRRKIKEEEGDKRKIKEEEGDKRKIKEEESDKRKIKEEEDKRKIKEDDEIAERRRKLPPRKRRKTVNFKLDPPVPAASVKRSFPLPAVTEDRVLKMRFGTSNSFASYKEIWGLLGKCGSRKELFLRRLHKGNVPIVKKP